MGIYLLVFVIALLYFLFAGGNERMSKDGRLLAIYFIYLALFVGLGDMIGGYDRYIYGESFDYIADITWGDRNYTNAIYLVNGVEYGYFAWQVLLSFITTNRYMFILFTTILIYALFYKSFVKYIDNYPFACIVFLGLIFLYDDILTTNDSYRYCLARGRTYLEKKYYKILYICCSCCNIPYSCSYFWNNLFYTIEEVFKENYYMVLDTLSFNRIDAYS